MDCTTSRRCHSRLLENVFAKLKKEGDTVLATELRNSFLVKIVMITTVSENLRFWGHCKSEQAIGQGGLISRRKPQLLSTFLDLFVIGISTIGIAL